MARIQVKLYGSLKQRFGSGLTLEVKDGAEAVRALCVQFPDFRPALRQGWFTCRIGRAYFTPDTLEKGLHYRLKDGQCLHITPQLKGAKKGGLIPMVLGAALIAASFFVPTAGLLGGMITQAGVFGMGAALMLGGVAQLLTPTPKMNGAGGEKEKKQSTAFSNLGNLAAQGRPVPLAYGRIRTGSLIISQGVETLDVQS